MPFDTAPDGDPQLVYDAYTRCASDGLWSRHRDSALGNGMYWLGPDTNPGYRLRGICVSEIFVRVNFDDPAWISSKVFTELVAPLGLSSAVALHYYDKDWNEISEQAVLECVERMRKAREDRPPKDH